LSLSPGSLLGSHEIVGLLGAGGMGEVYRARDTKLNRQVAIKILPEAYAADPDRVARFHREAQAVAALNHSNIAGIYDLAESGATKFLVLELIEGDTLADRLQRGPVPAEEALTIIKQVLEALEAAHEKGICHRDLKPANIKLTPDGVVKVLDFGLAKFMQSSPSAPNMSHSPTLSVAGTYPGVILGTAGYMSPEQAKGYEADQRSDLFSVGCILYELLSGRQAFEGETASEILAGVLKSEVDYAALPPRLNPRIGDLLRRCLEKNPKKRWHAAADVRVEIEALIGNATIVDAPAVALPPRPWWRRALPVAAGLVAGATISVPTALRLAPKPESSVSRFSIQLPEGQQFTNTGRLLLAISPDGKQLVYVANSRLFLRALSDLEPREIAGSNLGGGVLNPVFSPDGQALAFYSQADGTIKRLALGGGAAVTICQANIPYGMHWSEDGMVFGQAGMGIVRVPPQGGVPEIIVPEESGEVLSAPQLLPGGKAVIFSAVALDGHWDIGRIVVQEIGGARRVLVEGGADARLLPSGHLVFARSGVLLAVPFDVANRTVAGGPISVVEGVRRAGLSPGQTGIGQFAFSSTGSLVYLPGPIQVEVTGSNFDLALFDRKGAARPLGLAKKSYRSPRASPDGKFIVVDTDDDKESIVWIYELAGGRSIQRLTFGGRNRYPIWSRDGRWILFQSDREGDLGIFRQLADGSGPAERLTKPEQGVEHVPQSMSKGDVQMLFSTMKDKIWSLSLLSMDTRRPVPFGDVRSTDFGEAAFSPDGKWVAYQARDAGTEPALRASEAYRAARQVFVVPFPATGAKYLVAAGGHPYWSSNGDELTLNTGPNQSLRYSFTSSPRVAFGEPRPFSRIGRGEQNPATSRRGADSMPDGEHIIGVSIETDPALAADPRITVVLNWFSEVLQRVPRR
jgi:serine/threonine-protein kinase